MVLKRLAATTSADELHETHHVWLPCSLGYIEIPWNPAHIYRDTAENDKHRSARTSPNGCNAAQAAASFAAVPL